MQLLKIFTFILLLAFILIGIDCFTLSDNWRFYGWDFFNKEERGKIAKSGSFGQPTNSPPSGEGIFPDSAYVFTEGWHLLHVSDWKNHLKEFKGKPEIHALEIGNYEGLSAIWQIENILTHPTSTITCRLPRRCWKPTATMPEPWRQRRPARRPSSERSWNNAGQRSSAPNSWRARRLGR